MLFWLSFILLSIAVSFSYASQQATQEDIELDAHTRIFHGHLKELEVPSEIPIIFVCYYPENEAYKRQVEMLCHDLIHAGITEENIKVDFWNNDSVTDHQHTNRIFTADKVILIGSPTLKALFEQEEGGRGEIAHQIENLLTRNTQKGIKGIISTWFKGTQEENLPATLHSCPHFDLGEDYFLKFFDLLTCIYGLSARDASICALKENFRQVRKIPPEMLARYGEKVLRHRQETEERNQAFREKVLFEEERPAYQNPYITDKATLSSKAAVSGVSSSSMSNASTHFKQGKETQVSDGGLPRKKNRKKINKAFRQEEILYWEIEENSKRKKTPRPCFKKIIIGGVFIGLILIPCLFMPWMAILCSFLYPNNSTIYSYKNGNSLSVYEASINCPIVTPSPDYGMIPYNPHFPVNNKNIRKNSTSETFVNLKDPNFRSWKNVTSTTPIYYLEDRVNNFIESVPEHSEESYLTKIWKIFHKAPSKTDPFLSRQVTISGMGGSGKSSLSLSYAYEALKHKAYNIIYWIRSETEATLIESYKKVLKAINIPFEDNDLDENIIELIKKHIPDKGKSLLIYDNVPEPGFLARKVPDSADILITSRCSYGWPTPNNIEIGVFRPKEAAKYLFDRTNLIKTKENTRQSLELAKALGYLPLALSHVAGYISYINIDGSYGFNDYLQAFQQEPGTHFSTHVNPFSLEKNHSISHEHLISKTWSLAGQIISPLAKDLMVYFAYLEPDHIIRDYFFKCSNNEKGLREAVAQLSHFSLIKGSQHFYSIHRLVQLVIRHQQETLPLESLKGSLENALSSFENYRQTVEQELKKEPSLAKLNNLDTRIRGMHINTVTLFNHLQRISQSKEDEDFFPLKFYTLGLQYLVNTSTSIKIKDHIYKLLKGEDLDEKELKEKEIAIRNELTRKDIFLPDETIKRLAEDLLPIVPFDLSSPYLNYLIETIEKIKNPVERTEFVKTIVSLLSDTTNTIEILYPLLYDQVKIITDFLLILPSTDMQGQRRAIVIDAFMAVAPEDRADIIKYLPSLWDERMIILDKANIIKSIGKVAAKERKEFVSYIRDLYPKNINEHDVYNVIDALVQVPADQRLEITKIVRPLLHQKMRGLDMAFIIISLAQIDADQRSGIIRDILPLWNDKIEGSELAQLINSLAHVAVEQRSELVNLIAHLLNDHPLLKSKINGFIIAGVISSVKQVAVEQRSEIIKRSIISYAQQSPQPLTSMSVEEYNVFIEYLSPLCPKNMSSNDIIALAKIFIKIKADERADIAKYLPSLWNNNMGKGERSAVIEVLAGFTRQERAVILFLWNEKMTFNERNSILEGYFTIEQRENIIKYLPLLWNDNMSGYERSKILRAVSSTDSNEREDILKYVPSLWNDNMNGYERATVIKFLSSIDPIQRKTLTQLFQSHINDIDKNDWLKILSKLKEIPQEKRIKVSENFIFLWNAAKANNTIQNLIDLYKKIAKTILKEGGVANLFQIVAQAG
ncbi:hypothetical protein IM40_09785 (plasmid) [Candidatus Paracaedimonas acanthamoebae]|nr:hypothetical protein IM40_09785 [Candidatus Paracaedimonas acanthamoebae]